MAVTRFKEPVCDGKYHAMFSFVTTIAQFFVVACTVFSVDLSRFTCQFIVFIITTVVIHHSFTFSLQANN